MTRNCYRKTLPGNWLATIRISAIQSRGAAITRGESAACNAIVLVTGKPTSQVHMPPYGVIPDGKTDAQQPKQTATHSHSPPNTVGGSEWLYIVQKLQKSKRTKKSKRFISADSHEPSAPAYYSRHGLPRKRYTHTPQAFQVSCKSPRHP